LVNVCRRRLFLAGFDMELPFHFHPFTPAC
jgi:hypothetical protein